MRSFYDNHRGWRRIVVHIAVIRLWSGLNYHHFGRRVHWYRANLSGVIKECEGSHNEEEKANDYNGNNPTDRDSTTAF